MLQFSDFLKNERIRLGFTQEEMANACGISKRTYNHYEKGERAANSDFLLSFARIGGDINYLFTGERSKEQLDALERVALLAFNKLKEEGQKTSAITYMTMLEAGLVKGDFNSLWESKSAEVIQTASGNGQNNNQVFHGDAVGTVIGINKSKS
ncbi:XRE family transcriptional regulator [Muribacter muris]|uniref:XRE family transcriptional regulator n=1 Tax=Muribacter muris TaxID=67855 RepID=A0A4Y9JSX4_9PAST|nr:helix-turn-helix transcriptional regulator [Muribacter muris]MBF0786214.1 helix-turn-helix transcriptional regulator [Muribacter muris]MBF0826453.1 helix-turn-helix transcriptional regulator [Muribacter muris]TFV07576.1 XRE family transcriptional regulator [Muribacter muris]